MSAKAALKPFADAKEALIDMGFTKDEQAVISSVADNGEAEDVLLLRDFTIAAQTFEGADNGTPTQV